MFKAVKSIVLVTMLAILISSCSGVIAALALQQLLDDKAPKRDWTGKVTDSLGREMSGVTVQVTAEMVNNDDIMRFSDVTNSDGDYEIHYRWNKDVVYSLRVTDNGQTIWEQTYGEIELENRQTDITVSGTVGAEISGVIKDINDDPIEDALVVIATINNKGDTPTIIEAQDGDPLYDGTNEGGIFELDASIQRYVIVCAFHPDHGFAYAEAEDLDNDGAISVQMTMANGGTHDVDVRVVDINDDPISLQVLTADRQFRLRLKQPYNLSSAIDTVFEKASLFPGFIGNPSDDHPEPVEITVQATGIGGIAEGENNIEGSVYAMELLNVNDDNQATALITGDNPLVLTEDTTIEVRVN